MPLLIVLTMVATLSFYFYVLVQFVMEAIRRRHDTCTLAVPLHSVRSADAGNDRLDEENQPGRNDMESADPVLSPIAKQRPSQSPSSGQILSTFLRNRLSVISTQTGRLPAKHAAKG